VSSSVLWTALSFGSAFFARNLILLGENWKLLNSCDYDCTVVWVLGMPWNCVNSICPLACGKLYFNPDSFSSFVTGKSSVMYTYLYQISVLSILYFGVLSPYKKPILLQGWLSFCATFNSIIKSAFYWNWFNVKLALLLLFHRNVILLSVFVDQ